MNRLNTYLAFLAAVSAAASAAAVDLERFEFNDPNGTQLTGVANAVNPANLWSYAEEATTPGSDLTGDISTVQSGSYRVETNSAFASGIESRYLNIDNVTSGKVFLTATFAGWDFGALDIRAGSTTMEPNVEQLRFTLLDDDTGTSGSTVTAQVQIRRNVETGTMELFGDAIGSAGSFNIANTVALPTTKANPFTIVLAVDKVANNFEVFYKDGTNPSQVLGMGGVSRVRDANSIRMVTANFNTGQADFPPFLLSDIANLDRLVVSNTNPLTDLVTLEVNRVTGAMTLINTSGAAVTGITSVSLSTQTGSLDLSQLANFSGTLGVGQSVSLDIAPGASPGLWVRSPLEDIDALLNTASGARTVDVNFVGNGGAKWAVGDFDFNGMIDVADYLFLTANAETSLPLSPAEQLNRGDLDGDGENNIYDFVEFKSIYEAANGAGSFAQMLASIPEPTSLSLLAATAIVALSRRRTRQSLPTHAGVSSMRPLTMASLFLAIAVASVTTPASAAILEDFMFNDALGTTLDETANSANPSTTWLVDADLTGTSTTGAGALRVGNATTSLESNYIDIANITTGKAWLVVEMAGWSFNTDTLNPANFDPANPEQIRFGFLNNDPPVAGSNTLSGQFQIERISSSGGIQLIGNSSGGGSSNVTGAYALTHERSTPFAVAMEVDFTDTVKTYSVYYKDGATDFALLGTANIATGRTANSIRFGVSDNFSGDGEFFDIDRVYLTDVSPLGSVAPTNLSLEVNTLTGGVSILNTTDAPITFDSYRIASSANQLSASRWISLADQKADAVGAGAGQNWVEAGGAGSGVLAESFLLGGSELVAGELVALGPVFAGGAQDLTFEYHDSSTGQIVTVTPTYVTTPFRGDYNSDGKVDAADYTRWRDMHGAADGNNDGSINPADYYVWRANYGATNTANAVTVPETTSVNYVLLAACGLCLIAANRRRTPFELGSLGVR